MGAEDVTLVVKGGNEKHVKAKVKEACEEAQYESGHGGYTGTWAEWNGRVTFHNKIFKSYDDAYDYLLGFGTNPVCKKWEDAIAVQFRNKASQLNWLVAAIVSC